MAEHIVIGAGLAGAAAAWRLAVHGQDVTVVEQSTPANDSGSSHGSARIFRYAYPDRLYTDLVIRSRSLWNELEAVCGTRLISSTGALDFGRLRRPHELAQILATAGVEHELLERSRAQERWPQISFDSEVLWHPAAGVLDASTAVRAMLEAAVATGRVRVLTGWEVTEVDRNTIGLVVTSAHGKSVSGASVVVPAGGWLPHLLRVLPLPARFTTGLPRLRVRQEQAFHMPYRAAVTSGTSHPQWPTFIHKSEDIEAYSLPGGRDAGFRGQKIAEFNGGPVIDSARAQDGRIRTAARTRIIEYVRRTIPGLLAEPYAETTCLFTNTPSGDFFIDTAEGITIVSACSGHGAKFAPLLGEFAVAAAMNASGVPDRFRFSAHQRPVVS